jgi:hypothetical protein
MMYRHDFGILDFFVFGVGGPVFGDEVIVKVVNAAAQAYNVELKVTGVKVEPEGTRIVLASDQPSDENTLHRPTGGR